MQPLNPSLIAIAALALAGCGSDTVSPSAEQNADLDTAANLLDSAPDDLSRIDDSGLGEEDGADDRTASPPLD